MKRSVWKEPKDAAGLFELGSVLGQRKAFSTVAGRCSAAEVAAIRRVREERLYQATKLSWKEFCSQHLGVSRTQADRLIQLLDEFGPAYFEITQLTRIPPDAYRAIAPAVKDGHIHWQSEAIALIPENSEKVAAAVASLREAAKPPAPAAAGPNGTPAAMDELRQRTEQVVAGWARLVGGRCGMPPAERQMMKNLIGKARLELQRLEGQVWNHAK